VALGSFAEYERTFGGLALASSMSFAVRDYFRNGGSQAMIVRLFRPQLDEAETAQAVQGARAIADAVEGPTPSAAGRAALDLAALIENDPNRSRVEKAGAAIVAEAVRNASGLITTVQAVRAAATAAAYRDQVARAVATHFACSRFVLANDANDARLPLRAASPGRWGAKVRVTLDVDLPGDAAAITGAQRSEAFNLTVCDERPGGRIEHLLNLSLAEDSPRRIDRVLAAESSLLALDSGWPFADLRRVRYALRVLHERTSQLEAATDPQEHAQKTTAVEQARLVDPITAASRRLDGLLLQDPPTAPEQIEAARQELRARQQERDAGVNDGGELTQDDFTPDDDEFEQQGLYALDRVDLVNLVCIPPYRTSPADPTQQEVDAELWPIAASYCSRRRALLLVDAPVFWHTPAGQAKLQHGPTSLIASDLGVTGVLARNAALYYPRLRYPNPLRGGAVETFASCGAVAGVFARTDSKRGVWQSPAGTEATLVGVESLSVCVGESETSRLHLAGINCLRCFPGSSPILWGARTLVCGESARDEYQFIPVRRLALHLEESLYRGTQWAAFEPNAEPLWAELRRCIGAFLQDLFRQGAFAGRTPAEGYVVKCDKETTTPADVKRGLVTVQIGFAPLRAGEFVTLKIHQLAGQFPA
jgi:hypothetical protein